MTAEAVLGFKVDKDALRREFQSVQTSWGQLARTLRQPIGQIGEFDRLSKSVAETERRLGQARREVDYFRGRMQATGARQFAADIERSKSEVSRLGAALGAQRGRLSEVRGSLQAAGVDTKNFAAEQARLAAEMAKGERLAGASAVLDFRPHPSVRAEIEQVQDAFRTLKRDGVLSQREIAQAALKARRRIVELTSVTNGWGRSLWDAKDQFIAAGFALTPVALAVREAISFERAMADVRKVVDGTPEQLAALGRHIRGMSRELPMAADGLAAIAAAGGRLGIPIFEMDTYIRLTSNMASSFEMLPEEAGKAAAKMANVLGLPLLALEGLGDRINALDNTMAAEARDIIDVLTRVGGTARQFGLHAEQVAALGAAFVALGRPPEVASTAINALLNRLQSATVQSKTFKEGLSELGLTAEQVAHDVALHPQQTLLDLLGTLERLDKQSRSEVLTQMFGQEYADDLAILVGGLDIYRQALDRASQAHTGLMRKEAAARNTTTAGELKRLGNAWRDVGNSVGSIFLPSIRAASQAIGAVLGGISELIQAVPGLAALITVAASIAVAWGPLRLLWLGLSLAWAGLAESVLASGGKLLGLFSALATTPMGWMVGGAVAVTAAVAAFMAMSKSSEEAAQSLRDHRQEVSRETEEVRKLRETLNTAAAGTAEHTRASERLAELVPGLSLALDEEGRVVARLGKGFEANNRALDEYLAQRERMQADALVMELDAQARALSEAEDAVNRHREALTKWYGIGEGEQGTWQRWQLAVERWAGRWDSFLASGDEARARLRSQRQAFAAVAAEAYKSGVSVDDLRKKLDRLGADGAVIQRIVEYYQQFGVGASKASEELSERERVAARTRALEEQIAAEKKRLEGAKLRAAKEASEKELEARISSAQRVLGAWKAALRDAEQAERKHWESIRRLRDAQSGARAQSADRLRELRRRAMTERDQLADVDREINEKFAAARRAMLSGDSDGARKLAEQGQRIAEQLTSMSDMPETYADLVSRLEYRIKNPRGVLPWSNLGKGIQYIEEGAKIIDRSYDQEMAANRQAAEMQRRSAESFRAQVEERKARLKELKAELKNIDSPKVDVSVEIGKAESSIKQLQAELDALAKGVTVPVEVHHTGGVAGSQLPTYHTGGEVQRGAVLPGMRRGEVLAKLLRTEFVVNPQRSARYGGLLEAINWGSVHDIAAAAWAAIPAPRVPPVSVSIPPSAFAAPAGVGGDLLRVELVTPSGRADLFARRDQRRQVERVMRGLKQ